MRDQFVFDEVGYWSEVKQDIVTLYAQEYTKILRAQGRFQFSYIEGFSSSGVQIRKDSGEVSLGSAIRALTVEPPFDEYHFVDIDPEKLRTLKNVIARAGIKRKVEFYPGDCNTVLVNEVFPRVKYEDYRRALCLLDPYGLDLDWTVIARAGEIGTIDLFLNFPVMDANRNVLWRDYTRVSPNQAARLTRFWGGDWADAAYRPQPDLFDPGRMEKVENEAIAEAFRKRLRDVAGFAYVPRPIPMRNSRGATIYYLFFASPKDAANRIVTHLFEKYRMRGVV